MSDPEFRVTDQPSRADLDLIEELINEYNFETTEFRDGRRLAIFVRDPQGTLRGGLAGHTWGGCCEIRDLWIQPAERRRGLGSRLLRAAEQEAGERGCDRVVLTTHSFQAPRFYEKHGYAASGRFDGYPRGHSQIFMYEVLGGPKVDR